MSGVFETPNPGGADDPLGESILDLDQPWRRVFEPVDVRVVIGRGQDPQREVATAACLADGIPIHRRLSGGGTVILAPGMLVIAVRQPSGNAFAETWLARHAEVVREALRACGSPTVVRGHGDLAVATQNGERKVLGASLRQARGHTFYLGVLLLRDAVPLMERYLAHPSREPTYRSGRTHRDFCTHLNLPVTHIRAELLTALARYFPQ